MAEQERRVASTGLVVEARTDQRRVASAGLMVEASTEQRRVAFAGLIVEVTVVPVSTQQSLFCQVV